MLKRGFESWLLSYLNQFDCTNQCGRPAVDSNLQYQNNELIYFDENISNENLQRLFNQHAAVNLKISGPAASQAVAHSYPWQVLIRTAFNETKAICSGSLIESQWVVTAAHCVNNFDYMAVTLGEHNW